MPHLFCCFLSLPAPFPSWSSHLLRGWFPSQPYGGCEGADREKSIKTNGFGCPLPHTQKGKLNCGEFIMDLQSWKGPKRPSSPNPCKAGTATKNSPSGDLLRGLQERRVHHLWVRFKVVAPTRGPFARATSNLEASMIQRDGLRLKGTELKGSQATGLEPSPETLESCCQPEWTILS